MGMSKLYFLVVLLLLASVVEAFDIQYNPLLLQTKDRHGKTLGQALDLVYGDKITVKNKRCYFFETQSRGSGIEYEIDGCRLDYNQNTLYTKADRLNGIEIKGLIWIEGDAYRMRIVNGQWSAWKSSEFFTALHWNQRTGFNFEKRNGEFLFTPTRGAKKIHAKVLIENKNSTQNVENGNAKTHVEIHKDNAQAILNGEARVVVVQESETGKIIIQESR